jgi:hypothetical protein
MMRPLKIMIISILSSCLLLMLLPLLPTALAATSYDDSGYTITMGPFLTYHYIKGKDEGLRYLKIVATTPDGSEYSTRTDDDGYAVFEGMPWAEFPENTTFESNAFLYKGDEWKEGDPLPTAHVNYWEVGGLIGGVYMLPVIFLGMFVLMPKLKKKGSGS